MNWLESLLYGFVQGLTEFLPISSSAHLALLPKFLGFQDPGVFFDLSMHLGTALSIGVYFRREVGRLLKDFLSIIRKKGQGLNGQELFSFNFFLATVVTVVLALVIKDYAVTYGRFVDVIAWNFIIFGVVMALADRFCPSLPDGVMERSQILKAILIGLSQVVALFPGVSRSGATLTMARLTGLSRHEGTRFSFLLSLPLILGGMGLETWSHWGEELHFDLAKAMVGMGVSFLVSYLTIHYFLKWVSQMGLLPFALYRVAFGLFLFWAY